MGLIDDMRAEQDGRLGKQGKIESWMRTLADKERTEFEEALSDESILTSVICAVLRRRGLVCAESTVGRFRRSYVGEKP